jgi:hypothetical protein
LRPEYRPGFVQAVSFNAGTVADTAGERFCASNRKPGLDRLIVSGLSHYITRHDCFVTNSISSSKPSLRRVCTQLNDIAKRLERKLKWDPAKEEFVYDSEANRMHDRSMKRPWHL